MSSLKKATSSTSPSAAMKLEEASATPRQSPQSPPHEANSPGLQRLSSQPKMAFLNKVPDLSKSITVLINEGQPGLTACFTVPEYLLVEKSQYFKGLCDLNPNKDNFRMLKLQDVDVEAFNSYIYWACKDELPFDGRAECDGYMDAGLAFPRLKFLSYMWLIGDRLQDSRLRNTIMDEMIDVIEWLDPLSADFTAAFPPDLITAIWANSTQGCAIRRLVIDYYAYMVTPEIMEPHWDNSHPEFLKDLTMRSLKFSQKEGQNIHTALRERCFYHEHDLADVECEWAKCSWESVMSTMTPEQQQDA